MTETLALAPFGKNFTKLGFMPLLNAPCEDECKALVKAAETLGLDLLKEPFPGEPEELCSAVRKDIWRMWLRSNSKVRDSLILRREKVHARNGILKTAAWLVFIATVLIVVYSSSMFLKIDEPSLIILPMIMILCTIPVIPILCIEKYLERKGLSPIGALIDDNSHTWPYRIVSCLKFAKDKNVSLSLELQALSEFIDEVGPESNWGVVSLTDQIVMSKLSHSLESHKDRFSKGFILGLSGENSELVSRACSAVKPGRLEALMDRMERPSTQYL